MIAALLMAVVLGVDQPLPDAAAEARAQALMREIRCVACENEPVSQSTADIAVDTRRLIREKVEAGISDADIRKYFSDRYGDFVLFRPPTRGLGLVVWAFPLAILAVAGWFVATRRRKTRAGALAPLAEDASDESAS